MTKTGQRAAQDKSKAVRITRAVGGVAGCSIR